MQGHTAVMATCAHATWAEQTMQYISLRLFRPIVTCDTIKRSDLSSTHHTRSLQALTDMLTVRSCNLWQACHRHQLNRGHRLPRSSGSFRAAACQARKKTMAALCCACWCDNRGHCLANWA